MNLDKELVENIEKLQVTINNKINHNKQIIKFINTSNKKLKEFGKKWNLEIKKIGINLKQDLLKEIKQLKKL